MNAMFSSPRKAWQTTAVLMVFLLFGLFASFYVPELYSADWPDLASGVLTVLVAILSAVAATLLWVKHDRADAPRRIWLFYSIALWLWTLAEVIWFILNMLFDDVPMGWPDVFWIAAYPSFVFALLWQFRLLFHFSLRKLVPRLLATMLLFAAVLYLAAWLLAWGAGVDFGLDTLLLTFYPLGDVLIVGGILWLVAIFRNGKLGRPWYGMALFVVADLLYAWIEIRDMYAYSIDPTNILSTISDLVYIAAYLVIALGCFSQWLLLIYGPELKD